MWRRRFIFVEFLVLSNATNESQVYVSICFQVSWLIKIGKLLLNEFLDSISIIGRKEKVIPFCLYSRDFMKNIDFYNNSELIQSHFIINYLKKH